MMSSILIIILAIIIGGAIISGIFGFIVFKLPSLMVKVTLILNVMLIVLAGLYFKKFEGFGNFTSYIPLMIPGFLLNILLIHVPGILGGLLVALSSLLTGGLVGAFVGVSFFSGNEKALYISGIVVGIIFVINNLKMKIDDEFHFFQESM